MFAMTADLLETGTKVEISRPPKPALPGHKHEERFMMPSRLEQVKRQGHDVVLLLPLYKGKRVMLHTGAGFEITFYTADKGPYRSLGVVDECYKEDDTYLVRFTLKTEFFKIQRRKHYRMECHLNMNLYQITEEEAHDLDERELRERIKAPDIFTEREKDVILDISGGGIRFVSEHPHETCDCLAIHTHLKNEHVDQDMVVPVTVVACRKVDKDREKYEIRAAFTHMNHHLREMIIKYIFYEERKIRKKGRVR
jgi:c-di-GMP-binding flagellar brake protein YcgR